MSTLRYLFIFVDFIGHQARHAFHELIVALE